MRPESNKTKLGVKQVPPAGFGFVYALCDPRNPKTPKYVGRTIRELRRRLAGHICTKKCHNPKLKAWIESLFLDDIFPTIYVLETVPFSEIKLREEAWISFFRPLGLLNLSNGDGMRGLKGYVSPLNRAITAERNRRGLSKEVIERIRQSNMGRKMNPDAKIKMMSSEGYATATRKLAACNEAKKKSIQCIETGEIIPNLALAVSKLKRGWPKIKNHIDSGIPLDGKTWKILTKENNYV